MLFQNVPPSNARYMIAVDINGTTSKSSVLRSPQLKPMLATAAMAMLVARTETQSQLVGYSQTIAPARLSAQMQMAEVVHSLTEVTRKVSREKYSNCIDDLVQYCCDSSAIAMELLQSCNVP